MNYNMNEIKPAAARLFKTRDGELVLAYLRFKFYDSKIDNDEMARQVGQRDVIHFLNRLMEADNV